VNKSDLIEFIALQADISKASATRALDAAIAGVVQSLRQGDSVTLTGLGTLTVVTRAPRTGRNPRTGAPIQIKKARVPRFRPAQALKDALN
jgi:DNA-binding protein HU-beta